MTRPELLTNAGENYMLLILAKDRVHYMQHSAIFSNSLAFQQKECNGENFRKYSFFLIIRMQERDNYRCIARISLITKEKMTIAF